MSTVSPSRSGDTFYYHVKLLTLRSAEPYTEPFNFKINLQKGIQKLDSTRKTHTFEGSELNLEDVVTFQMPFYNPTKKKINFNLLLVELAEEEIEVCTAALPVGDHTQDFMNDNSQKIFQGTTSFDDNNFTIDYILYVDRVKASLLALIASQNQSQAIQPKSARESKRQDTKFSRLPEFASPKSPQLKMEAKSDIKLQQKVAPTRVAPIRDIKPSAQRVQEPQPELPKIEAQFEQPIPIITTKRHSSKADIPPLPPRNLKKELKEQKVEVPVPTVISPSYNRNSEKTKTSMQSSQQSTGKAHLNAPHTVSNIASSIDVTKHRKEEQKQKQAGRKGEVSNSKMGLIIAAVIIAALVFGFLLIGGGSKPPKGKGGKERK